MHIQKAYNLPPTLAGVGQWFELWPVNWKVTGLIPPQGTCLSYRPGPQLPAGMPEATDWCISQMLLFLSLSFSLPSPLSKSK